MKLSRIAAGIGLTTCALSSASAPRTGDEGAGYVFASPPVNALGVKGMADLHGKPVLIDFWGTH